VGSMSSRSFPIPSKVLAVTFSLVTVITYCSYNPLVRDHQSDNQSQEAGRCQGLGASRA